MIKQNSSYMPQLDALRTFAVAMVIYSHWIPKEFHFGFPLGHAGVQLFFVLSGFLITGILLRCREFHDSKFCLRAFYIRRFLRIFPLFYAILFLGYILKIHPIPETILWHLSYLSNIYFFKVQEWSGCLSHFWSLAVEEQFYLIWPTVILFIPRKTIPFVIILTILIGFVSRYGLAYIFPDVEHFMVLPTSALVSLGLGAALACERGKIISPKLKFLLRFGFPAFVILFMLSLFDAILPVHSLLQYFALMLGFTWLVDKASLGFKGTFGRILNNPVLIYLGSISYGLYVLHNFARVPVVMFSEIVGMPFLQEGIAEIILKLLFTVVGASLSWHLFESPINNLKRHFPYSPKANGSSEKTV
jgi:peptidoglycan/LPS O-acetylase OafA/YrhL